MQQKQFDLPPETPLLEHGGNYLFVCVMGKGGGGGNGYWKDAIKQLEAMT